MGEMTSLRFAGHPVDAYVALPTGTGPGVLVLHEWWGLLPHFTRLCDRLAAEGFVAMAPDFYAGATTHDPAEAARLRDAHFPGAVAAARAAADELLFHPRLGPRRIGAVGFSIGADLALMLARERPLHGVVSYYGALGPGEAPAVRSRVMGHYAAKDEFTPLSDAKAFFDALGERGVMHSYAGTRHSFANDEVPAFDPHAADLAWQRTVEFLRARLAPMDEARVLPGGASMR